MMYDNRANKSSYSCSKESSSYMNYNGDANYNSSYQYEFNADPNTSHGSLRSHDVSIPNEDMYNFGSSLKRSSSGRGSYAGPSAQRSNSIHSNQSDRLSARNTSDHLVNGSISNYDGISEPGYYDSSRNKRSASRASSVSRQNEPMYNNSYNQYEQHSRSSIQHVSIGEDEYAVPHSHSHPLPHSYAPREEFHSSTLPHDGGSGPAFTSSPEPPSEAIVEEERINPDGSTVIIRRVVTATTTHAYHENDVPKVEVHISPATETIISPPTSQKHQSNSKYDDVTTSTMYQDDNRYHTQYIDNRYDDDHMSQRNSERAYSIADSQRSNRIPYGGNVQTDRVDNHSQCNEIINTSNRIHTEYDGECNVSQSNISKSSVQLPYGLRAEGEGVYIMEERVTASNEGAVEAFSGGSGLYQQNTSTSGLNMYEERNTTTSMHQENGRYQDEMAFNGSGKYQDEGMASSSGVATVMPMDNTDSYQKRKHESGSENDDKKIRHKYDIDLLDLLMYLKTDDSVLKANTAGYIMHLSYNDDEVKKKIREVDLIPMLVKLLDHEDEDCHRNAAGALKNLSYGRFLDDNKTAIRECGGIAACTKLLYRTSWIEVREHVTGVLYNISSVEDIKHDILVEAAEAVAVLIVIPLSGWEKELAEMGKKLGTITWSPLLRNSTGMLRNVSSAGMEARNKIRSIDGLVDCFVWILRAAIAQEQKNAAIDNKIVENVICTLRNLSYKVDVEIDRNIYLDAQKVAANNGSSVSSDNIPKKNHPTVNQSTECIPQDAAKTGCIGMKKKTFITKKRKPGKLALGNSPNKKPPPEQWQYLIPVQEHKPTALGVELLWQQNTVSIYIYLLTNSTNPITLEASAAAMHNLCGCKWNWAGLLRVHIRLQKGIPPMHDLLSVDQEYVVRSIAYALRNLAIDRTNKWSIGKFVHTGVITVLPPVNTYENESKPSEHTICAVLSVLQVIVYKDFFNSRYVKDDGGITKLIALTREAPSEEKRENPLRVYSERVVLEANRVLLYMWEFKECRDAIKKEVWSYGKAEESEKEFGNATLKKPKQQGDTLAVVETDVKIIKERDSRRYVDVEDNNGQLRDNKVKKSSMEEHEMRNIGCSGVSHSEAEEIEPLVRKDSSQPKKKNTWFKKDGNKENNIKKKHGSSSNENSKLMDGEEDTFV